MSTQLSVEETKELIEKVCKELETEKRFKQGKDKLCKINRVTQEKTYCCLGLMIEVADEMFDLGVIRDNNMEYGYVVYRFGDSSGANYIPLDLVDYLGINKDCGTYSPDDRNRCLSYLNDSGKSFKEIAKVIRKNKQTLFPLLKEDNVTEKSTE